MRLTPCLAGSGTETRIVCRFFERVPPNKLACGPHETESGDAGDDSNGEDGEHAGDGRCARHVLWKGRQVRQRSKNASKKRSPGDVDKATANASLRRRGPETIKGWRLSPGQKAPKPTWNNAETVGAAFLAVSIILERTGACIAAAARAVG